MIFLKRFLGFGGIFTPGLLATDIHIQIQIILTINLSEHVLNKPNKPTHKHM